VSRDFALDDGEVSDILYKLNETVVSQDVFALDALEHRVAQDHNHFEVSIKVDRGGLAARRLLQEMAHG
jgi:acetate kinase